MDKISFMKYTLCISFIVLLLSGCSIVSIESEQIPNIVNDILGKSTNLKSVSLEGYSYYLPQNVSLKSSQKSNSVLYYNHNKMYLYVDLVSYYNKTENTYSINNNSYYSDKINLNGKSGYLEISELENKYFVEFMYNYSKFEAYVSKDDLNKTITQMAYILRSIKFQDKILDSLIGEASLNYTSEQFNIYKTNGTEKSDYLEYVEEHDDGRKNSKDEDILEIDENFE